MNILFLFSLSLFGLLNFTSKASATTNLLKPHSCSQFKIDGLILGHNNHEQEIISFNGILNSTFISREATNLLKSHPLSQSEIDGLLLGHNREREMVCSPSLKWNTQIQATAQAYSERCLFGQHSFNGMGENLFGGSLGGYSVPNAVGSWSLEKNKWTCGTRPTFQTGHYTQVVWNQTEEVGCGASECRFVIGEGQFAQTWDMLWVVCNYNPGGNNGIPFDPIYCDLSSPPVCNGVTTPPTISPTQLPTISPTQLPTISPTQLPTNKPTQLPTILPTNQPTNQPTISPTITTQLPTILPTNKPTISTQLPISTTISTQLPISTTISPLITNNPIIHPTSSPTFKKEDIKGSKVALVIVCSLIAGVCLVLLGLVYVRIKYDDDEDGDIEDGLMLDDGSSDEEDFLDMIKGMIGGKPESRSERRVLKATKLRDLNYN